MDRQQPGEWLVKETWHGVLRCRKIIGERRESVRDGLEEKLTRMMYDNGDGKVRIVVRDFRSSM